MSLTLHYGSGSPYAWKVWLALEHKQLAYDLRVLSFDRGDHKTPEFLALNPRGKVPVLVDGEFTLFESNAIVEYLEDAYPEHPLLPRDARARARIRRIAAEADDSLYTAQRELMQATLYVKPEDRDPARIAAAIDGVITELGHFAGYLDDDGFGGRDLTLADFTVYPFIRLIQRVEDRIPTLEIRKRFPPAITRFVARIDALPYAAKTLPPHWRG